MIIRRRINKYFILGTIFMIMGILLFINNIIEDKEVGKNTSYIVEKLNFEIEKENEDVIDYIKNPNMEMPMVLIDGNEYIGYLIIESLKLKLPVMNNRSYDNIKIAPARYKGSIYNNNMIILAHNYDNHFGKLYRLRIGDNIRFIDIDNNEFDYKVEKEEELLLDEVEKMIGSKSDLTLFTCTIDGKRRTTIRCQKKENNQDIIRTLNDNLKL